LQPRHSVAQPHHAVYGVWNSSTLGLSSVALTAADLKMENLAELVLIYLAIGAVLFALIPGQALPVDFHWRNQANAFRDSLPEVLAWPRVLWHLCRHYNFLD
jgi:hypothetical protein